MMAKAQGAETRLTDAQKLRCLVYGSVCSGIEAASVSWGPLGWEPAFFSEIEPFPCAVLKHHYQHVPNHGDMTKFREWPDHAIDVLCGGTPCQSFSVAGLRKGLADPRGNLSLTFLAIADRYRPRYVIWENVPGVLSSNGGRDFAAFLGGLGELGYGWCYRIVDAQYARVDGFPRAVPQRRRRVVVVGCLGDWRRAAAVLSEPESVLGDSPPRREAGQGIAADVAPCIRAGGNATGGDRPPGTDVDTCESLIASTGNVAHCLNAGAMGRIDYETETMIAHSLRGEGFDSSEDGTGRGTPIVPVCAHETGQGWWNEGSVSGTLRAEGENRLSRPSNVISTGWAVRRLTPTECARLQGFPDDYLSQVTWRGKCPPADGPMYKALGNSWAVNVFRWVGTRIELVEEVAAEIKQLEAAE